MKHRQRQLAELNDAVNNKRRKTTADTLLLFIAQMAAETNGNIRWLIWIAGLGFAAGISFLIALAVRGMG